MKHDVKQKPMTKEQANAVVAIARMELKKRIVEISEREKEAMKAKRKAYIKSLENKKVRDVFDVVYGCGMWFELNDAHKEQLKQFNVDEVLLSVDGERCYIPKDKAAAVRELAQELEMFTHRAVIGGAPNTALDSLLTKIKTL